MNYNEGIYSDELWARYEGEPREEDKPLAHCKGCGQPFYRGDMCARLDDGYYYCADCALSPIEDYEDDGGFDEWDAADFERKDVYV